MTSNTNDDTPNLSDPTALRLDQSFADTVGAKKLPNTAGSAVGDGSGDGCANTVAVPKPSGFDLNKFKSKRADAVANVDTLQTGLPVSNMSQAKDFVRLHPDEDYWSPELCFVMVPIKGASLLK